MLSFPFNPRAKPPLKPRDSNPWVFSLSLLALTLVSSPAWAQSSPTTHPSLPTSVVSPSGITHALLLHSPLQGKTYKIAPNGDIAAQYPTGPKGEDSWLLPTGRILASYSAGVREFDPATHSITWEYHASPGSEIHSCQPLPGDRVLICECGSKRLFEINRDLSIVHEIRLASTQPTHKQFRLARKTPTNTYLVSYGSDALVRELDADGNTLQTFPLPPRKNAGAHGAFRLPNGHTLITGGYGLEAYEFDSTAHITWTLTPSDLPANFHLHYIGSATRLKNGNTLFTNFQGQPSLFEITPDKHVVWQYQNDAIGPISDCLILDE